MQPQEIPAAYNEACKAYETRKYDIALEKLNATLEEDSKFAPAFYIKGLTYMQLQDWRNAYDNFKAYSQITPEKGDTYLNMGTAMLNMKQPRTAISYFDFALSLRMTENRPERAHLNKALAFRQINDNDKALESFEAALKLHPHFDDALLEMAKLQLDLGKNEEALTYYQRVIDLPKQRKNFPLWEVWVGLALVQTELKQFSKALISIEESIELNPNTIGFFKTNETFNILRESEYKDDFETILG
ncbi:tetratricopeptide repeat protein [Bernardetia sp.]|uniref:tetratricopeptide repeat protein n=1 Tax=Bernardetia sp. TaxID=1937974 RepID=UPI0025B9ADED|nr:tetratricopeptide repeat protein [Bernardetia sp.]